MNQQVYRQILRQNLLPCARGTFCNNFMLVQDNAPPHKARARTQCGRTLYTRVSHDPSRVHYRYVPSRILLSNCYFLSGRHLKISQWYLLSTVYPFFLELTKRRSLNWQENIFKMASKLPEANLTPHERQSDCLGNKAFVFPIVQRRRKLANGKTLG